MRRDTKRGETRPWSAATGTRRAAFIALALLVPTAALAQTKKNAPDKKVAPSPPQPHPPPIDDLAVPAPPSAEAPFDGAWAADMTANYSSCDDVKVGDARHVRWTITPGKTATAAALAEKGGAKGDAAKYTGDVDASGKLALRAGKQAGLELTVDNGTLKGRHVVVRKGTCAVVYDVTAMRPTDQPMDVGTTDPDASSWTIDKAVAGLPASGVLAADIDTAEGTITCELFPDKAPVTVANFVGLARGLRAWRDPSTGHFWRYKPYYEGLTFHRVIPGFVIQGGDPLSRDGASAVALGTGGPGYTIPDEQSGLRFDQPGRLAMANKGPGTNSAGSQFFITEVETPSLDRGYAVFGQCGPLDVVQKIARLPADPQTGRPTQPAVMKVRIYKK
jgi:cyclophilin family peptidyl-prolyl cis-trans isomerase